MRARRRDVRALERRRIRRAEGIDADHFMAMLEQCFNEVRPDEAGRARYDRAVPARVDPLALAHALSNLGSHSRSPHSRWAPSTEYEASADRWATRRNGLRKAT